MSANDLVCLLYFSFFEKTIIFEKYGSGINWCSCNEFTFSLCHNELSASHSCHARSSLHARPTRREAEQVALSST